MWRRCIAITAILLTVICLTGCDIDALAYQADTAIGRDPVKEKANGIMNSIAEDFEDEMSNIGGIL